MPCWCCIAHHGTGQSHSSVPLAARPPGRGCPGRHDPWKRRLVPSESQSLSASSTAPVPKVHHWKGLYQPVESCLVVRVSTLGPYLALPYVPKVPSLLMDQEPKPRR